MQLNLLEGDILSSCKSSSAFIAIVLIDFNSLFSSLLLVILLFPTKILYSYLNGESLTTSLLTRLLLLFSNFEWLLYLYKSLISYSPLEETFIDSYFYEFFLATLLVCFVYCYIEDKSDSLIILTSFLEAIDYFLFFLIVDLGFGIEAVKLYYFFSCDSLLLLVKSSYSTFVVFFIYISSSIVIVYIFSLFISLIFFLFYFVLIFLTSSFSSLFYCLILIFYLSSSSPELG